MANAYTSAQELGFPAKAERAKDAVRAELLAQRLDAFVRGECELSPAQVQAAKILIDKGKPNLSSVDQTLHDAADEMTESELAAKIKAVVQKQPELLSKILGEIARQGREQPEDKETGEKEMAA